MITRTAAGRKPVGALAHGARDASITNRARVVRGSTQRQLCLASSLIP